MPERPILYLDVDDTLLRFPPDRTREWWEANRGGAPADGVAEFLAWAVEHWDVRWLTCWTYSGSMRDGGSERLAKLLRVPQSLLDRIHNPRGWDNAKPEGIDWEAHEAGVPWLWIEDGLPERELAMLDARQARSHYVHCDSSRDPSALMRAWEIARAYLATPTPEERPDGQ